MRNATILPLFFLAVFFFTGIVRAETKTDVEILPDITLTVPENKAHVEYMGLKGEAGTTFKVSDIDADILLIELFSMYCPYCQQAAPAVNELYEKMEQMKRPDLKLVIIGIGANNTDLEVNTFREGFGIEFPLFSDPDMAIYNSLQGKGTPGFLGCKKGDDKTTVIFYRKSGGFSDASAFLEDLLNASGLK